MKCNHNNTNPPRESLGVYSVLVCEGHDRWVEVHTHTCQNNIHNFFKEPQKCTLPFLVGFDFEGNLVREKINNDLYIDPGVLDAFEKTIHRSIINKAAMFTIMMCEELKKWNIVIEPKNL